MFQKINFMFGLVMIFVYFGAGMFFLLGKEYLDMNETFRIAFGLIVLFYGVFRGYKAYLHFKKSKEKPEEEN
ncbi:MAG: hypothetical protein IT279_01640 [Ignavibacteriaceae bacterium]|nr:hypothetical protein [Ignavibacteriaceae bacterium]